MILKTDPPFRYRTEDGLLWDTMTEAVDHEAKLEGREDDNPVTHADYENVFTIQEAINMAVAEMQAESFDRLVEERNMVQFKLQQYK